MNEVSWIFRSKKRNEKSIENVFENMEKYIENECRVNKFYLPEERYFSIRAFIKNLKYAKSVKGNINHITGEVTFCAFVLPPRKTVITIHDFVILHRYKGVRKLIVWLFLCYLPYRRSGYLTAISQSTYEEAIKRFPWCENKLRLIMDPISDDYIYNEHMFNKTKPVILIIGANPNKNFERVIEAISGMNVKVDIIAKLSDRQESLIKEKTIDYSLSSNISNEEMIEHYNNCDLVCFASTYEGFGMIIVEAQAVGRPVVTSNIEPMISVSGGAAELVDPYDIGSIRMGLQKVINDDNYREKLINAGLKNCLNYRAAEISNKYLELYREMCEKNDRKKNRK